jgi:hypothetical protein
MRQERNCVEHAAERAGIGGVDHDDQLAARIAAKNLAAGHVCDGGIDLGEMVRARLHQDRGDLAAGWRHDAVGVENTARDRGAAIDGLSLGPGSQS